MAAEAEAAGDPVLYKPVTAAQLSQTLLATALTRDGEAAVQVRSLHGAKAALAALRDAPWPDWLILDLRLPDDPQRTLFQAVCAQPALAARTVLMSAELPLPLLRQSLGAGLRGFLPKSADPAQVLAGFEPVRRGEIHLPPEVAAALQRAPAEPAPSRHLSPRLREVQARVLAGTPNKRIARELGLSESTVKEYMSSILAYHGVANRLELVLKLQGQEAG